MELGKESNLMNPKDRSIFIRGPLWATVTYEHHVKIS